MQCGILNAVGHPACGTLWALGRQLSSQNKRSQPNAVFSWRSGNAPWAVKHSNPASTGPAYCAYCRPIACSIFMLVSRTPAGSSRRQAAAGGGWVARAAGGCSNKGACSRSPLCSCLCATVQCTPYRREVGSEPFCFRSSRSPQTSATFLGGSLVKRPRKEVSERWVLSSPADVAGAAATSPFETHAFNNACLMHLPNYIAFELVEGSGGLCNPGDTSLRAGGRLNSERF